MEKYPTVFWSEEENTKKENMETIGQVLQGMTTPFSAFRTFHGETTEDMVTTMCERNIKEILNIQWYHFEEPLLVINYCPMEKAFAIAAIVLSSRKFVIEIKKWNIQGTIVTMQIYRFPKNNAFDSVNNQFYSSMLVHPMFDMDIFPKHIQVKRIERMYTMGISLSFLAGFGLAEFLQDKTEDNTKEE
jgi:hypothetical protein